MCASPMSFLQLALMCTKCPTTLTGKYMCICLNMCVSMHVSHQCHGVLSIRFHEYALICVMFLLMCHNTCVFLVNIALISYFLPYFLINHVFLSIYALICVCSDTMQYGVNVLQFSLIYINSVFLYM